MLRNNGTPGRFTLVKLWVLCVLIAPFLLVLQLGQALFGSPSRSFKMALALDAVGNALLGGEPTMTVSTRVGNGLKRGEPWATPAAKFIDMIFGKNHCLDNADI